MLQRRELDEYFEGKRHTFDLAVDVALLADFNRRVLRELARVPYGEVVTYGELATRAARPRAARAVGMVMNRNPLPIVLPCHRVNRSERESSPATRAGSAQGNVAQARRRHPVGSAHASLASHLLHAARLVRRFRLQRPWKRGTGRATLTQVEVALAFRKSERKVTRCQCRIARRCN